MASGLMMWKIKMYASVAFFLISFVFIFFRVSKVSTHYSQSYGYFKDGRMSGQVLTECESILIAKQSAYFSDLIVKISNLEFGEKVAKKYEKYSRKAKNLFDSTGKIDIRKVYSINDLHRGLFEKSPFFPNFVKKNRSMFRKTLTKEEKKCLNSAISKLTLKQKLELGGYLFFV